MPLFNSFQYFKYKPKKKQQSTESWLVQKVALAKLISKQLSTISCFRLGLRH